MFIFVRDGARTGRGRAGWRHMGWCRDWLRCRFARFTPISVRFPHLASGKLVVRVGNAEERPWRMGSHCRGLPAVRLEVISWGLRAATRSLSGPAVSDAQRQCSWTVGPDCRHSRACPVLRWRRLSQVSGHRSRGEASIQSAITPAYATRKHPSLQIGQVSRAPRHRALFVAEKPVLVIGISQAELQERCLAWNGNCEWYRSGSGERRLDSRRDAGFRRLVCPRCLGKIPSRCGSVRDEGAI